MAGSPTALPRPLPLTALGLVLLGVVLIGWALTRQVGEPPAVTARSAPATSTTSPGPGPGPHPQTPGATGGAGQPVVPGTGPADTQAAQARPSDTRPTGTKAARARETDTLAASEPVHLRIPSIEVDTPLHPLGLDDDGRLTVPGGDRYDEAAWYDGSPTPGEAGPSVIEGHVTSSGSTPSVFFALGALETGDLVEVDREDGTTVTFEVYDVQAFPKDSFPKATVYGNTQGAELRLITCGGVFDPGTGTHLDNVVVFARSTG